MPKPRLRLEFELHMPKPRFSLHSALKRKVIHPGDMPEWAALKNINAGKSVNDQIYLGEQSNASPPQPNDFVVHTREWRQKEAVHWTPSVHFLGQRIGNKTVATHLFNSEKDVFEKIKEPIEITENEKTPYEEKQWAYRPSREVVGKITLPLRKSKRR